jgi:hypothetical protein
MIFVNVGNNLPDYTMSHPNTSNLHSDRCEILKSRKHISVCIISVFGVMKCQMAGDMIWDSLYART